MNLLDSASAFTKVKNFKAWRPPSSSVLPCSCSLVMLSKRAIFSLSHFLLGRKLYFIAWRSGTSLKVFVSADSQPCSPLAW
eukprot:3496-Heterococcus_DN1.PRE.1